MKKSRGSPFRQAHCAILCSASLALSCLTTFLDRGFTRSYISPFRAAFMNVSVTATLMLKLVISFVSVLQVMNSRMSGWSTRRMPMLAPRRVPPCLMCSVDWLYTFMNDTGHIKQGGDRKSTRLNSSHDQISYAVFCLKKQTGLGLAEFRTRQRYRVDELDLPLLLRHPRALVGGFGVGHVRPQDLLVRGVRVHDFGTST